MIDGHSRGPRAPDKRDIAQMIFFEVAAQWESFCTTAFELEVKQRYSVLRPVARHIMSDIDRTELSGYGSPDKLVERAENLLSKGSPLANFKTKLHPWTYDYLFYAYRIRNFIAHAGVGKGQEDFRKVLGALGINGRTRMGLSAGRFLLDYRDQNNTRWFEALLLNYKEVADYVLSKAR